MTVEAGLEIMDFLQIQAPFRSLYHIFEDVALSRDVFY